MSEGTTGKKGNISIDVQGIEPRQRPKRVWYIIVQPPDPRHCQRCQSLAGCRPNWEQRDLGAMHHRPRGFGAETKRAIEDETALFKTGVDGRRRASRFSVGRGGNYQEEQNTK